MERKRHERTTSRPTGDRGVSGPGSRCHLGLVRRGADEAGDRARPRQAVRKPGTWGTTIALYDPALYGPERPLSQIVAERRLRLQDGKIRKAQILVNKAQRRLELWVGRHMVKAYRIQLGWRAHGPKERLGDQKTPEGTYFICAPRPSAYYLGLWLAYPNAADARRGLESGLIGPGIFRRS